MAVLQCKELRMGRITRSTCYAWNTMKSRGIFFVLLTLVVYGEANLQGDDASAVSCSSLQQQACRKAAQNGQLDSLNGGGICEKQRYVHYTHTCTLNNYLPAIDYCCCTLNQTVLCCRYSQNDHDLYRCQLEQDFIGTISDVGNAEESGVQLGIILPLVLVPLILLVIVLVCCIYRQRKKKEDKRKRAAENKTEREYELQPLGTGTDCHEQNPDGKRPLDEILDGNRLLPSAPSLTVTIGETSDPNTVPAEDGHVLPSYESHSHPEGAHGVPGGGGDGACTPCPSCSAQPPSYTESLLHPVA